MGSGHTGWRATSKARSTEQRAASHHGRVGCYPRRTPRIAVSNVSPPGELSPALDRQASLRSLFARPVEGIYESDRRLVVCNTAHPLAQAAHDAFFDHLPLVLSPDAIWFCIAQGFAHHVNLNTEALRKRLVRHQGKKTLSVTRADFELGQPNPWPEVFASFSEQIAAHVGKLRNLVVADFSTTGPIERAASEVLHRSQDAHALRGRAIRYRGPRRAHPSRPPGDREAGFQVSGSPGRARASSVSRNRLPPLPPGSLGITRGFAATRRRSSPVPRRCAGKRHRAWVAWKV